MISRPMNAVVASALSVIGGIIAIASSVYIFNPESSSVWSTTSLGMLMTVLSFATAGFLYRNGKGNYPSLIFIEIVNIVVVIVSMFLGYVNVWFGLALVIIALLVFILSVGKNVSEWIVADRV